MSFSKGPIDYRDLEAPAQLQPFAYDDGSGQANEAASKLFGLITNKASEIGTMVSAALGSKQGLADGVSAAVAKGAAHAQSQTGFSPAGDATVTEAPTGKTTTFDDNATSQFAADTLSASFQNHEDLASPPGTVPLAPMLAVPKKTGFLAGTAYAEAYNNSAQAAYTAAAQTDVASNIERLEQDNQGNLPGFQQGVTAYLKGLESSTPPEVRAKLQLVAHAQIASAASRIHQQELHQIKEQQLSDYYTGADAQHTAVMRSLDGPPELTDAAMAQAVLDNNHKVDALLKSGAMTGEQAATAKLKFQAQLSKGLEGARLQSVVDGLTAQMRGNVEQGDAALAQMRGRTDLDESEKEAIAEAYEKQRGQLTFERSRTHAADLVNLAGELAAGGYGHDIEARAHQLYRLGATSVAEFSSQIETSIRNERKGAEQSAAVGAVLDALDKGHGLDPRNTDQVKAVDLLFQTHVQQANETPGSERYIAGAAEFARKLNIVPDSMLSWARVGLLSGDPSKASVAAAAIKRIQDANPAAAPFQEDVRIQTLASLINDNLAAGLNPESAYNLASTNVFRPAAEKQVISDMYAKGKYASGNPDALRSVLKSLPEHHWYGGGVPDTPVALQTEYESLTKEYFIQSGGDINKARELAGKAVMGLWGVTNVNGQPELTKYPPEKIYGISPDIIRADVTRSLKAAGYDRDPSTVRLVPNGATVRTKGRVWSLLQQEKEGSIDAVLGKDNRPVLYQLPLGQDFEAARKTLLDERLRQARVKRAVEREHADAQIALEKEFSDHYLNPNFRAGIE